MKKKYIKYRLSNGTVVTVFEPDGSNNPWAWKEYRGLIDQVELAYGKGVTFEGHHIHAVYQIL